MMMKLVRPALVGLALACMATNLAAKSAPAEGGYYTTKDKEYYLTHDQLIFIRPGLELEIMDVAIPADRQLEVTYKITDPGGLPLDINGVYTPGEVQVRYILSYIPVGEEQKTRLVYDRRSTDGTLTDMGDGVYMYKSNTALDEDYQMDATYTLAVVGRRDLRYFDLDRYAANEVHHFVPSGMYDPMPREVVTIETCNGRCHDPLTEHGRYQDTQVCTQCHNPGLFNEEEGLSYSFNALIHRVHAGTQPGYEDIHYPTNINDCEVCHTGGTPTEAFPLVANPRQMAICDATGLGMTEVSWGDVGRVDVRVNSATGPVFASKGSAGSAMTGKWAKEGTKFFLTSQDTGDVLGSVKMKTTVLGCVDTPPDGALPDNFRGAAGLQHTNWMDHPSRLVCGSCHADVDFENGVGHLTQQNDDACDICHAPDTGVEFDASVRGTHQVLMKSSQFPGLFVEFLGITDTAPGDKPTVSFLVKSKTGLVAPLSLNRLRLTITGPNEDFSYYNQEAVDNVGWDGNGWTYTFKEALPPDAMGSYTVSVEGRSNPVPINGYEDGPQREYMANPRLAFAVTGDSVMERRVAVADYNCEACHVNISLHGGNRKSVQYCQTCHLPEAVDRLDLGGNESIHFKYMIHKIHRGHDLENGYVVVRSRGVFDFSDIHFPGDLRNCKKCHVDDSYEIPLPEGLLATITPGAWWSPTEPIAAACLSCHDGDDAAAHAYSNTTIFGEACGACHGEGMSFSVEKVHAR